MSNSLTQPFISVVVPMYKVERYIKVCIDSILNQTFQDFEIIIVDDASPDNCYEICQKLYGANEKVHIVRHVRNKGLGPARNTGIENARGKYVYFVDSDDLILPNALEILYNVAKETEADVIHNGIWNQTTQDDDKPISTNTIKKVSEKYNKEGFLKGDITARLQENFLTMNIFAPAWLNMCSLEFLQTQNLKFLNIISEDEIFTFDLLCHAERFFVIRKPIYIYRKRENSIMKTYDEERLAKGVASLLTITNHVKNQMDNISETAYNQQIQEDVLASALDRQNVSHILPFYNYQNIFSGINQIVFSEFLPIFGQNALFVKHLFNTANFFHNQFIGVSKQADRLATQNNQIRGEMISAFRYMPVTTNKIVFINFNGRGYGCNPKYIAEEILRQNLPYKLVWLVSDMNTPMPEKIRKVLWNSTQAAFDLASAKVIITNVKNSLPFVKKSNQYFIMTWHGDGMFKYVEKDCEDQLSPGYVASSKQNSAITDLMLAGSEFQYKIMHESFWYNGEIAKIGLPRNDIFFNPKEDFKAKVKKYLNIPAENKIILYGPTFRDNQQAKIDVYQFNYKKLVEVVRNKFGGKWTLAIRFHPNVAGMAFAQSAFNNPNIVNATNYPDVQELIVACDAVISDYSSLIQDFSVSKKPVFIFAKDVDTYPKERKLRPEYFNLGYPKCKTEDELFDCIKNFDAKTFEEQRNQYLSQVKSFDDGHASEKLVEIIKNVITGRK